jgi:hypothetical protein
MSNLKKQDYYSKNREDRLRYQKEYYVKNKNKIRDTIKKKRKGDPEWAAKEKKYNQDYYAKNKRKIMVQRLNKKPRI